MSAGPNNSHDIEGTLRLPASGKSGPQSDAATATPLADSSKAGSAAQTATSGTQKFSIPLQELSGEALLADAPVMQFDGRQVPSLGGIPLLAKLGQGGMGAVYFGIKPLLKQEVAVKVLPKQLAMQQAGLVDRFLREAQIAARVESPHLVRVTDVGEQAGLHYLVMEYVRGESAAGYLKRLMKSGQAVGEATALDICIAATEGLCAAHQDGVIHRDVKPDNILLPLKKNTDLPDFSSAKLADLGLARGEDLSQQSLTGADATMGTPGYMAPEQALNARKAGKSADVFSMGATVYALLTGKPPFRGETATETVMQTLQQMHVPLKNLRPDVSAATASLVERCLAKDPAQRFTDAFELKTALQSCRGAADVNAVAETNSTLAFSGTVAPPVPVVSEAGKSVRPKSGWGLRILGGAALLALAAVIYSDAAPKKDGSGKPGENATATTAAALVLPTAESAASKDVLILTSPDKEAWMRWAAGEFQKTPEAMGIQLRVTTLDSEPAREGLLSGKLKPNVWSPACGVMDELFKSQWKHSNSPFVGMGASLAGSPMVCVLLEDRYSALIKKYKEINTRSIIDAIVEGSWAKIGGPANWGEVRFALPDMNEPESAIYWGVQVGFKFYEGGVKAEKVRAPEIRPLFDALRRATKLPASSRAGAEKFIIEGAAVSDGVAMFESSLLKALETHKEHAKINVIYQRMNLWNDHPYYVLDAPWSSPAQRKTAEAFQNFLLSDPAQRKLLESCLRPVSAKISLRDESSPWMRHQKLGVTLDVGVRNKQPNIATQRAILEVMK